MSATRLGFNDDGTLDEIVAENATVHLEQLGGNLYWLSVEAEGRRHIIKFWAKKTVIKCTHEEEREHAPRAEEG